MLRCCISTGSFEGLIIPHTSSICTGLPNTYPDNDTWRLLPYVSCKISEIWRVVISDMNEAIQIDHNQIGNDHAVIGRSPSVDQVEVSMLIRCVISVRRVVMCIRHSPIESIAGILESLAKSSNFSTNVFKSPRQRPSRVRHMKFVRYLLLGRGGMAMICSARGRDP